ncbi:hypothetical protein E6B08_12395 [Pseudomonas putida]|uniref:Uncharacterized protein n=1 Tax=Pseudomonas putida TaxID=303 RepID=A0A4D6X842_PSEPU|nr:neuraminidase-like domain-containing protein [Pseudomonas putida]QCI12109.1 hypothetical protein E6B08_12395 [Pseudomonas putida]
MSDTYSQENISKVKQAGFESLAAMAEISTAELQSAMDADAPIDDAQAEVLHADANDARDNALLIEKKVLTHASPLLPSVIRQAPDAHTSGYLKLFGKRAFRYASPSDVASKFSPAAYLVQLYHHAQSLYPKESNWHIDKRRPDLQTLVLSQTNLDTAVSALSLSNDILLGKAVSLVEKGDEEGDTKRDEKDEENAVLRELADDLASSCLPYHHHYSRLRAVLAHKSPDLQHLREAPLILQQIPKASLASIHYDIPPALHRFLIEPINDGNGDEKFAAYFPRESPEAMLSPFQLRVWSGLSDAELQGFMRSLDSSDYIGNTLITRVGDQIIKLTVEALYDKGHVEYLRFYPTGDNEWKVAVKYKKVSGNDFWFQINEFNSDKTRRGRISSREHGDEIFIAGKEYSGTFNYPYDQIKEPFTVETVRGRVGIYNYKHRVRFERLRPSLYLLRIYKLICLHKATQLPLRVLEGIIDSVDPNQITDHTLAVLFQSAQWVREYGISHEDALLLAGGDISTTARQGEVSQFDRLFNNPPLVPGGFLFDEKLVYLNPELVEKGDGDTLATLRRACQVDEEGLYELGLCLAAAESKKVTVRKKKSQVSRLYTLSLWARLHSLRPAELRQLLNLIGLPDRLYTKSADDWLQLLQKLSATVKWLAKRNWSVHDLHLMTRPVTEIAASAQILNLQRDMKAALDRVQPADAASDTNLQAYTRALTPVIASTFNLGAETAAQALLRWTGQGKPGNHTLLSACTTLRENDVTMESPTLTAFIYGLAQRALIVHACHLSADVLEMLVQRPSRLRGAAQANGEPATVLDLSLQTIMSLADFSDWLKHLPDPDGAGGALLAAMSKEEDPTLGCLAKASGMAPVALAQAADQACQYSHVKDAKKLSHWREIDALRQWTELSSALDVMPDALGDLLKLDFAGSASSDEGWASWAKVANAFVAGLNASRTAQVQSEVLAPMSHALGGFVAARQGLRRDRLDQYLLLDTENGSQVITSRIAEATTAVQTFINRCLTQPEDKSELVSKAVGRDFFRDWTRWNARYATWSAGQMLMYYPENYIDPIVRLGQTQAMDDMLQALGQAQINHDTVGDAFQGYLSAFEQVADLETVSGYHDSREEGEGRSYFVGRGRGTVGEYWWRTLNERKRHEDGVLPANAWSSWTKIDLTPQVVGGLIRPVVFRERLYLGWVERENQVVSRDEKGAPRTTVSRWSFKLSWRRYDGNWSTPLDYPIEITKALAEEDLALLLCARPERNCLTMVIYNRREPREASRTTYAGLEIHEDLNAKSIDPAPIVARVPDWLDSQSQPGNIHGHPTEKNLITGMCAVYNDGREPVAQLGMLPHNDSPVPAGFVKFQAKLTQQPKTEVKNDGKTYELVFSSDLEVDGERPQYPNKWASALVRRYSELAEDHSVRPMLVGSGNGAAVVRKVDNISYAYVCLSRERFESVVRHYQQIDKVHESKTNGSYGPVDLIEHVDGDHYCMKFSAPDLPQLDSIHLRFRIKMVYGLIAHGTYGLRWLLNEHGTPVRHMRPKDYQDTKGFVPASEVSCTVYSADEKHSSVIKATENYDISARGSTVRFNVRVPIGNLDHWGGGDQALHKIRYQFGKDRHRDYVIRVFKSRDTLRTAVIGFTAQGAQYLERRGWVTRLNTLFARQLTERAVAGLDQILNYTTQNLPEPGIGVTARLTLPKYIVASHGDKRDVDIVLAHSDTQHTVLWTGALSDEAETVADVTFASGATYDKTAHYYLQIRYQKQKHNTKRQSIIIDGSNLQVLQSSDIGLAGNGKLSKNNVQTVEVMPSGATVPMDFTGANALYFWELFYYAPMMVMQRFLQEERYDQAEQWLRYIFNPLGDGGGAGHASRMWNVRPLEEGSSWNDAPLRSLDPDAVAQNDPMHYKLNAFMRLLDINIGRGDAAYRKLERDSLAQAKIWYQRALDLLGDAPWTPPPTGWKEPLLKQLASVEACNQRLDQLECLERGEQSNANKASETVGFLPEANRVMLGYWETLRLRLYNLRNNLSLDGQPLNLPLYAERADPKAMLAAAVAAQAGGEGALPELNGVPALRFTHLLDGARTMVSQLIQFGSTMQGILERQDAEALASLLTTQGAELAQSNVALFKQKLNELAAERLTLEKSLETATLRRNHYQGLYEENISSREMHALDLQMAAGIIASGGNLLETSAAIVSTMPNIFGLANGGGKPGSPLKAAAKTANVLSQIQNVAASRISQEEGYRRRRNDWNYQCKTAEKDMAMIQAQLEALDVRETSAQMQLAHLRTQSAHAEAQLALHHGKFTGKAMYSWLRARLASIFYTYYDLAVTRCLMAQKALQWEMGDPSTTYLRTGTWNGAWAGLLCGEGLMLALGQMDNAWTQWQMREMEVTRTVSLAKLMRGKLKEGKRDVTLGEAVHALISGETVNVDDSLALCSLTMTGEGTLSIQVGLQSLNLAAGFERSKSRRVRSIAVTLPGLMGPYQNVHARLTTSAKDLPVGCDQSAISHAVKDTGMFTELNGYPFMRQGIQLLPFEGLRIPAPTDVDKTTLTLSFPSANKDQKALLESLSNIILDVQFTVR